MDTHTTHVSQAVQVMAITSGKGGVGKTTASVNLAAALKQLGRSVMIMDADLGLANIDVMLGLKPKYNLSHVLEGERTLNDVIVKGPQDLLIVPAASGIQAMSELSSAEHQGLIHAFSHIGQEIDTLIIDTAAGLSDAVTSFCKAAHEVVVVVTDEPASMADAYALIKVLNCDHGVNRFRILTNMVESELSGFMLYRQLLSVTDRFLDVNLDHMGSVPRDQYQQKAVRRQALVCEAFPRSKATRAWNQLAGKVETWLMDEQPSGKLEFFFERLFTQERIMEVA